MIIIMRLMKSYLNRTDKTSHCIDKGTPILSRLY